MLRSLRPLTLSCWIRKNPTTNCREEVEPRRDETAPSHLECMVCTLQDELENIFHDEHLTADKT